MDVALPDGDEKALEGEDDDEDEEEDNVGDEQARAEQLLKQRWVVEDQCRWTIFEDLEDELKYHRRRSRALCCFVRAYGSLREERERLQTAGLGLQDMYEQMEEELREAVGDAAYWRALAEGDAGRPGRAQAKGADASEGDDVTDTASSAATSEEEVSSGEDEATMEAVFEASEHEWAAGSAKRCLDMSDESETSDDEETAAAEAAEQELCVHQGDAENEDEVAEQQEVFAAEQVEVQDEAPGATEEVEFVFAEQPENADRVELEKSDSDVELEESDADVLARSPEKISVACDKQKLEVAEQAQEEEHQAEEYLSEDDAEPELHARKGIPDENAAKIISSAAAVTTALDSYTSAGASSAKSGECVGPQSPGLCRRLRVMLAKCIAKLCRAVLIVPLIVFPFTSLVACSFLVLSGVMSMIQPESAAGAPNEERLLCYLDLSPVKMRLLFTAITGAVDWASVAKDGHLAVPALGGVVAETGCNSSFPFSGSASKAWPP